MHTLNYVGLPIFGRVTIKHNTGTPVHCNTVDHVFFASTKFSRISRGHLQSRKYCARERSKFGNIFGNDVVLASAMHVSSNATRQSAAATKDLYLNAGNLPCS